MADALAMTAPDDEARRRRNVRLALVHAAIALGFLVAFVWAQVHR
jgi:hypothetical protein